MLAALYSEIWLKTQKYGYTKPFVRFIGVEIYCSDIVELI